MVRNFYNQGFRSYGVSFVLSILGLSNFLIVKYLTKGKKHLNHLSELHIFLEQVLVHNKTIRLLVGDTNKQGIYTYNRHRII